MIGWNRVSTIWFLAFHFPPNLVKVIMSCVSTSNISILVNEGTLESFAPFRGIKQGDPLSPYLFILCMEHLGHLIEKKCTEGAWTPLKASRENMGFTHLFFVDELILFSKVSNEACDAIFVVLEIFCKESSPKISAKKSRIYFSPNVNANLRLEVCNKLSVHETTNIGSILVFQ